MQGYSYRLVERASIVSATYAQVVGYSTATGQTITGVENASEFDVGDFGIVQYAISDRNNTIGYVTCEVTSVGADSLTVNGIGISVSGADGADGKDGAPGADGKDGAATVQIGTVTTGAAGSQASVTNVGADNAAILNFTIPRGDTGAQGIQGEAATIQIGQVLTGEPGTNASVENVGTENAAILNFTIPRGATGAAGRDGVNGADGRDGVNGQDGADGAAATIQIGEVVTGEAGTNASVENTGTENAAVLKFTIPRGATGAAGTNGTDGAAATIEVGEVTTGAAGTQASVTNSGTTSAAVLDFTIPQGADGASGVTDVTAGTPTEQNGYTVTPVTFNFEQGNSKTVNIQAKNGAGAGVQQNAIINRTATKPSATADSPDFVENNGDLWVKKITSYAAEVDTLPAPLPSARNSTSAATALNGKIYVFGGRNSSGVSLDDIVEFDPEAQTVTTLEATLPSARWKTSAATAPNGKIYVFGGSDDGATLLADILEFDPVTQTVTTLEATLPSARNSTSAATAPNGKIYVFGGSDSSALDDIVEFDPEAQTVTTLDMGNRRRSDTSAATAPNGKIYVFGGVYGATEYNDILEFDPVTQRTSSLNVGLPERCVGTSAATAPNGKIYVFGGYEYLYGDTYYYYDDIIEFDPVSQEIMTLKESLPSARDLTSAATAPNGKIYVFGGVVDGGTQTSQPPIDDIVEFDPPVAQYDYLPAVVLSQTEYTQLKNILKGIFAVGISAPSAEVSGTLSAGNTTVNGTLTATGDISTVGDATVGADLSVMGDASAQNVTASSFNATT